MNLSSFKARLLLIGFLFVIALKFWLIWESEIRDATDDPHEYLLQILYPSNGGLSYPPGVGIVGGFFYGLGIPFRLALEALFLTASALVLKALIASPWKSGLSLGLFVFMVFDPAPNELFTHFFSDPPWLIETMLGAACFVLAFRRETRLDWSAIILSVCFFGLSIITRSIIAPLLISVMVFALFGLAITLAKFRSPHLKRNLDYLALSVPTIIFGLCILYGGVCRYNYARHGYSGLSYIDSNEYKKFYVTLQSVGDPTGAPYFPIDQARRRLIAQAGPDSRWFVDQLDQNAFYKNVGVVHYGTYDIPAGWFHWATFTAAMDPAKGDYTTAFSLFKSVEDEIANASVHNHLKVRTVLPLPDSRLPIVAQMLPSGFHHTLRLLLNEPPPDGFTPKDGQPQYVSPEFTKALNRRSVEASPLRESIWRDLTLAYSWIYTKPLFYLYVITLAGFGLVVVLRWKRIDEFSPIFVARQMFTILFLVLILWYALFDASGMPTLARYMMLNHLLLLPLICSYVLESARLLRKELTS